MQAMPHSIKPLFCGCGGISVSYLGSLLFEIAKGHGRADRDVLRHLPLRSGVYPS